MSFNVKVIIISLVIITSLPVAGVFVYRQRHPKYIPPPPRAEVAITIIPGWNLKQVAEYLVKMEFVSSTTDVYKFTGYPLAVKKGLVRNLPAVKNLKVARDKPDKMSWEGYLAPETFRVYKDATVESIIEKLVVQRDKQISSGLWAALPEGKRFFEILTLASIVEKKTRLPQDI